jgi:hypothetical protein
VSTDGSITSDPTDPPPTTDDPEDTTTGNPPPPDGGLGPWGFGFAELGFDVRDVVLGDFHGDSHVDVFTSAGNTYHVYRGTGDGRELLADTTDEFSRWRDLLRAADVDDDGDLDVAAFHGSSDDRFFVAINDGNGAFGGPVQVDVDVTLFGFDVAVIDADGNGLDDFVTALGHSQGSALLLSQADGAVLQAPGADPAACYVSSFAAADFDQDGWEDVVVTGSCNSIPKILPVSLYAGSGGGLALTGSYAEGSAVLEGCDVVPVDFDGDGDLDVVTGGPSALSVLRGDGAGGLEPPLTVPHAFDGYTQRIVPLQLGGDAPVAFVLESVEYDEEYETYPRAVLVEQDGDQLVTSDLDLGGWVVDAADFDEDGRNDILVRGVPGDTGPAKIWLSGG